MVTVSSRVEGRGETRPRAPFRPLQQQGRDAESRLQITVVRVDKNFSSDTKLMGFSDKMDGDGQEEEVTEDVYGGVWESDTFSL